MMPSRLLRFPRSGWTARRFVRRAALSVALMIAAPLEAQVGRLPDKSPYEDFAIGQTFTLMGGWFAVATDLAKVAPKPSAIGLLRYDIGVGGPASLWVRYGLARSERDVLLPSNPRASRIFRQQGVTTQLMDGGLDIALTGRKTWHRLLPSVNGGAGVATDFAKVDTGAYQFGTKFSFTYGGSLRIVSRSGPQLRVDISNITWQYQYPDKYFVKASDTTSVLTDTRNRTSWRGSWSFSAGVAIPVFR